MMQIRRANSFDLIDICMVVRTVVEEKYGHLLSGELPIEPSDDRWLKCWVADQDGRIVGVGLAERDCIDDLWVLSGYRNNKVGSALLKKLERQISAGGYPIGRLRVVAENDGARRFYASHSWRELKTYPHERDGHLMVDLRKHLI